MKDVLIIAAVAIILGGLSWLLWIFLGVAK